MVGNTTLHLGPLIKVGIEGREEEEEWFHCIRYDSCKDS